jgi:tyrosine-protein kinase Etk/Wzc
MEDELNFSDYYRIIRKYKYLIGGLFAVAVIAAMLYSLALPKTYQATTTILPPMDTPSSSGLDMLRSAGIQGINPKATPSDIFIGILKSRQMQDDIIDNFNLMQTYNAETRQSARSTISGNTEINVSREQFISVSYIDKSPEQSARIANFYVQNLDNLNRELNITTAGQIRRFTEERLTETRKLLKEAEENLKEYRIKHKIAGGIYSASVSAGGMESRLIAKRIELEAKQKYRTGHNAEIIRLKNEITQMEKALEKMPPVDNELARLIRELRTQETIHTILVRQYEQAKIEEARDTPTVQVIDRAVVPEQKYGPKIKRNMAMSGFAALFLGIFLAFSLEYVSTRKHPPAQTSSQQEQK